MRKFLLVCFSLGTIILKAQQAENLVIITTDGYRWQEVFGGMDAAIADNSAYNQKDSAYIFKNYGGADADSRRKALMPFFWNTIAQHGQIWGNRWKGSEVNVSNPYWFSYPGYSEIMCGYVDTAVNSNAYKANPNSNFLEFLNHQPGFNGRVAAFGAWDAFDRILNEERSGFPVVSAFDPCGGAHPNDHEKLINAMLQDAHKQWRNDECYDVFTHYEAMETLKHRKPRVLYIAYGETDEWAHGREYRSYLDAAHQVDAWIKEIWDYLQSDPQYRNKTTLLVTTDHGRGDTVKTKWTSHGQSVEDAYQIWFAAMGPGIKPKGEMMNSPLVYQKQFAQTLAGILGLQFTAEHPVAPGIKEVGQ